MVSVATPSTVTVLWSKEQRLLRIPLEEGMTVEDLRAHLAAFTSAALQAKDQAVSSSLHSLRCGYTELSEKRGDDLVGYHCLGGSSSLLHLTTRTCTDVTFDCRVHLVEDGHRVKSTSCEVKVGWDADSKDEPFPFHAPSLSFLPAASQQLGLGVSAEVHHLFHQVRWSTRRS